MDHVPSTDSDCKTNYSVGVGFPRNSLYEPLSPTFQYVSSEQKGRKNDLLVASGGRIKGLSANLSIERSTGSVEASCERDLDAIWDEAYVVDPVSKRCTHTWAVMTGRNRCVR